MRAVFVCLLLICFSLTGKYAEAQINFQSKTPAQSNDSFRIVVIQRADVLSEGKKDSVHIQYLKGHVALIQGRTRFYADSVVKLDAQHLVEAFGNVHINDSSTDIYSQYMRYHSDTRLVVFQKKVTLTDGKGVLTTDELQYDMNTRIGTYDHGGKVVNEKTVVTSDAGTYYAETKDVYFKKNVVLKDPAYGVITDSLLYNTELKRATFITETTIQDSSGRTIHTREGFYDLANHHAEFGSRPRIVDGAQTIIGDSIQFDDSTGISIARGNAVFKDTAQKIAVLANLLMGNRKENTLLATIKPLMIIKQDKDSIYITGDTLYSGKIPDSLLHKPRDSTDTAHVQIVNTNKTDSSTRFIQAFHHVRIFSDSLQAVADSMYYSGVDSIFRLYTNPVAWANGVQITGDTMYLYTKNKKPDRLYVFENGFAVEKVNNGMFSQVKGTTINGYFKDGAIDYMRVRGNAESIYYVKDEQQALVGVNRVNKADIIDLIFKNKELDRVVLRRDVDGVMYPIKKVNPDDLLLRSFKWQDDRRPKTKYELFQ